MNKKRILQGVLIVLFIGLVIAQLVPPDKIDGPIDPQLDLSADPSVPVEVAQALKTSCYDCHSNQPNYPWYAKIGAVNWYLTNHMVEGNQHLNFSEWANYSAKDKSHHKEEICEEIKEGEMPLWSYKIAHRDVLLSEAQIAQICAWTAMDNQ